jgi:hypothetical protein
LMKAVFRIRLQITHRRHCGAVGVAVPHVSAHSSALASRPLCVILRTVRGR